MSEYIIEHIETPLWNNDPLIFDNPVRSIVWMLSTGLNITDEIINTIEKEINSLYMSIDIINNEIVISFNSRMKLVYIFPDYHYRRGLPACDVTKFNDRKLEISSWGIGKGDNGAYVQFSGECINNFIMEYNSCFNTKLDYIKGIKMPIDIKRLISCN